MKRLVIAVSAMACQLAHAEPAFSPHTRDNNPEDLKRAQALIRPTKAGPAGGRPMGFFVSASPQKRLVGVDLKEKRVAWNEAADVKSRVMVGPGLIVHRQGADELVGRDPLTGKGKFSVKIAPGTKFIGAAVDEDRVFYVVQSNAGARRTSDLVALDHGGSEKWRQTAAGSLGAPAARGGVVAVPFAYQNLVLLDGKGGKELARIRATDAQISYVRGTPEGFFYGAPDKGVVFLDEKSISGTQADSSHTEAKLGSEQVKPAYYWDAYQASHVDYSAFDRNRLLWRAEARQSSVAFVDNVVFLHNYRYLFAFDAWSGKLRWVYANPRIDIVSSEDARTSVVLASADGDVSALDGVSGAHEVLVKTGLKLTGGTIDAEGLKVTAKVSDADLAQRLEQIVWDPDARFTAVKVFAARALGDLPGKAATLGLLRIVQKDGGGLQPTVQKSAGERLVSRKDCEAASALYDALKASHYDFLAVEQHRGADVIARALGALDPSCKQDHPQVVAEIAAHLRDPETSVAALSELVAALSQIAPSARKEATSALVGFLMTYRADATFLVDPASLVAAAGALLTVGGAEGHRTLVYLAGEDRTLAPLKAEAAKLLAPPKAKP